MGIEIISRHSSCGNRDGLGEPGVDGSQAERSKGVWDSTGDNVRGYSGLGVMSRWAQTVKGCDEQFDFFPFKVSGSPQGFKQEKVSIRVEL